jgi:hypothetical protein
LKLLRSPERHVHDGFWQAFPPLQRVPVLSKLGRVMIPFPHRARVPCVILVTLLACLSSPQSQAQPSAPYLSQTDFQPSFGQESGDGYASSGPGISVLATAVAAPVAPPAAIPMATALPDPRCSPGGTAPPAAGASEPDSPSATDTAAGGVPALSCLVVWSNTAGDTPVYALGLGDDDRPMLAQVGGIYQKAGNRSNWFASVASQSGVIQGDQSLGYRRADGLTYAVGNLSSTTSALGVTPQLGGIYLGNTDSMSSSVGEGRLDYSSSFGRLGYTNASPDIDGNTEGTYGKTAGVGMLRYGLSPGVTLEGQMQTAPSLTAMGFGTTYSAGTLGTLQAGATQSSSTQNAARRLSVGYDVQVTEAVKLGFSNQQIGAGYSDLSTYDTGPATTRESVNTFSAGVPVWGGTLAGTYSDLTADGRDGTRTYGVTHTVAITPNLKLALAADREVVSGDYAMTANITMPVDLFLTGLGFSW